MRTKHLLIGLMLVSGPVLAQEYTQNLVLTRSITTGTTDQKATETIVASSPVSQGASAYFTAGKSVTLQPGFVAQAGSVFMATVAPVLSTPAAQEGSPLTVRAFPNPFSESTTLDYYLPLGGRPRHMLMDAKGQIIRQSEAVTDQEAGSHKMELKGNNLPDGVYLYQIQVGNQSHTLRLLKQP